MSIAIVIVIGNEFVKRNFVGCFEVESNIQDTATALTQKSKLRNRLPHDETQLTIN
jgi:hypothetical protein